MKKILPAKKFLKSNFNIESDYNNLLIKLIHVFKSWWLSKLAKDASKLVGLQIVGQVISFFASTYAMRQLGPTQLGIGAFVISTVAQAAVLGDFGMNISGVRLLGYYPENREETVSLVFGLRIRAAIILSILLMVIMWWYHPVGDAKLWVMAIPLLFISMLSFQWVFQGVEKLPTLNIIQVGQMLLAGALYLFLFKQNAKAELYLEVNIISQLCGWFAGYWMLVKKIKINIQKFSWNKAWDLIKYSKFAFIIKLTIFAYTSLEIPLITYLLTPTNAGIYRSALSIVGAFSGFMNLVPLLLYPRLIAWKNQGDEKFKKNSFFAILTLVFISIPIFAGALLLVPIGFHFLLGNEFDLGIVPAIILVASQCFVLVGGVPAWGFHAYDLDNRYMWITIGTAITSVTLNLLLIPHFGIIAASIDNMISESLITGFSMLILFRYLQKKS